MKTIVKRLTFALAAVALVLGLTACPHHHGGHDHHHAAASGTVQLYPLENCVVSGEKFDHGSPYIFVHESHQIKLCCKDCLKDFQAAPAKYLAKLDVAPKGDDSDGK